MEDQQPRRRTRRSDWFGSGPFNWFEGASGAFTIVAFAAILAFMMLFVFARAREKARRCTADSDLREYAAAADRYRERGTKSDLRQSAAAVARYYKQHRHWPSEVGWLHQISTTEGPALSSYKDHDAWGHPIRYRMLKNKGSAVVESAGRDGKFGTKDDIRQVIHQEAK